MLLVNKGNKPADLGSIGGYGDCIIPPVQGGTYKRVRPGGDAAEYVVVEGQLEQRKKKAQLVKVSDDPVGRNYIEVPEMYRAHCMRMRFRALMRAQNVVFGEEIQNELDNELGRGREELARIKSQIEAQKAELVARPVAMTETPEYKELVDKATAEIARANARAEAAEKRAEAAASKVAPKKRVPQPKKKSTSSSS